MRITRIEPTVVRLPAAKTLSLPVDGTSPRKTTDRFAIYVQVETDAGPAGLGFGAFSAGVPAIISLIRDDLTPVLLGADPIDHERLYSLANSLDYSGISIAYALIDIALWDIKAKAAGVPLWKLLGGARDRTPIHCSDTAAAGLSAEEAISLGRTAISRGMRGVRIGLAGSDPEADAQAAQTVHDALGEDIWFGISVQKPYDYETALPMGRFIEEEIGADWFEDPLADDDVESYARLCQRIDTPLAAGSRFTSVAQFVRLLDSGARVILRPDVLRVGGITPWLKVAAYAEVLRRPVVPHGNTEVSIHLACGLPGVQAADHISECSSLFTGQFKIANGAAIAPDGSGLGLALNASRAASA
jgi:L-alanine-DL-glutamate epimerase-like enolase superfamily enzyme